VKIGRCTDVDKLRSALSIAVEALGHYEDVIDGQYGPRPNTAMEALTQISDLIGTFPISLYQYYMTESQQ